MDSAALISKISQRLPGAVLSKQRFGKNGPACIWIDAQKLRQVAEALREDREGSMDWLECLGAAQVGADFLLNYFVRSTRTRTELVLRVSCAPARADDPIEVPSVRSAWPMAEAFERELSELFGIRFGGNETATQLLGSPSPREAFFPLRKGVEWARS